ncbi:hypothetical protein [Sphingopyxis sp. C-1]|uniref:hypothetical protein n=1 Tax=Sphingopyxis sp. C-1 TaxID=262667 RepID=UPI0006C6654A|nr:hypothetical protein [Sphingopyxis sp. C-1]GAO78637.1 hypothetical protein SC1_01946 [Sphingopyxis sp. C-1]
MFGVSKYVAIGAAITVTILLAWSLRLDALRADWREKFMGLTAEAGEVLAAVRLASDNPKLQWKDTSRQVEEINASRASWKNAAELQSGTIDAMGRDTERLRAENAALSKKVAALNAKREALVRKLNTDALDPGDVADCWAQIQKTEDALNLLYRESF